MTRQAGPVSTDPTDALVEIMQTVASRMANTEPPPDAQEAYTLGLIMGTACRSPVAFDRYKKLELDEQTRVRTI